MFFNIDKVKKYILYFLMYFFMTGVVVLFYFAISKRYMLTTSGNICLADFIDGFATTSFSNIIVIPFSVLLINVLSNLHCSNFNYYLRMYSRTRIIVSKILKDIIFSLITSLLIVCASIFVGGLMTNTFMNWNSTSSYYYIAMHFTFDADFIIVALVMFFELFITFCFYSILMCMLEQLLNTVISFIITLVLCGTNIIYMIVYYLTATAEVIRAEYMSDVNKILCFGVYPVITIILVVLSIKLIKRKDLLT